MNEQRDTLTRGEARLERDGSRAEERRGRGFDRLAFGSRRWSRYMGTTAPPTFDALSASYNFWLPSDRVRLFTEVALGLLRSRNRPRRVLDIG